MYSKEELIQKINEIPYWYHKINLPHSITTPGWAPINQNAYRVPVELEGKRVLDIGAWDGFWTFEALKRGAAEVVAIDDFSDYLGHLTTRQRNAWETFDLCKTALGYSDKQCKRIEMNLYDINENELGHFDVVFFFGTLYHLRHPLLALDKISSVCKEQLYVETAILDDYSPYNGGLNKGYPGKQMLMEFYPDNQYGNNNTNWWCPTLTCLAALVYSTGFKRVETWKLIEEPDALPNCRGFAMGSKV